MKLTAKNVDYLCINWATGSLALVAQDARAQVFVGAPHHHPTPKMIIPVAIPRSSFHPIPHLNRPNPTDSRNRFIFQSSSPHRTILPLPRHNHRLLFLRAPTFSSSILSTSFKPPSVAALSTALIQDVSATVAVLSGAYFLVLAFDKLTDSAVLEQVLRSSSICVKQLQFIAFLLDF